MKAQSQCSRLLAMLKHGPCTSAEIEQFAGHMRVNSRIADLRSQGHNIPPCEHTKGESGPGAYVYRLDGSLTDGGRKEERGNGCRSVALEPPSVSDPLTRSAFVPEPSHADGSAASVPARPTSAGPSQLSLEVAA